MYWAAEPSEDTIMTPWDAYKNYSNSGVSVSDKNGKAILHVRNPARYKKPYGLKDILPRHVHYLYSRMKGLWSPVFTKQL